MNTSTEKALDRLLKKMERSASRKPRRFSTAPIMLAIGLILGYQLLVRIVPAAWDAVLPGGIAQAERLSGVPRLLLDVSRLLSQNFQAAVFALVVVTLVAMAICWFLRPLRWLVWLVALGVILLDGLILIMTLKTAYTVTMQSVGLG